jgi:hypothetical protein
VLCHYVLLSTVVYSCCQFFAAEEMKHPPLDTLQLAAGLVHFLGASTAIYEGSAPYKPNIWGVKGLGTNVTPNY